MYKRIFIIIVIPLIFCIGCTNNKTENKNVIKYFSSNYKDAREKFIKASLTSGASIENFQNPNRGPEKESLYTDIALIGPKNADHILVIISGIHGVEGFAGSAIQTGILQEGIISNLKPNTAVIMIHALNPYGFAYLRRVDENNIDPNRNFIDHSKPYPKNKGYQKLTNSISPNSISFLKNIRSIFKLFLYGIKNGRDELKLAISGGQYIDPKGIFYGGQCETWSNKIIKTISNRYFLNAKDIIVLDIHTGLGTYGNFEIISDEKEESLSYKHAKKMWGDKVKSTTSKKSVSVYTSGSINLAFPNMVPNSEVTFVTLEFGTVSALRVFWMLRTENWFYHHGKSEELQVEKIKTKMLKVFYPNNPKWKYKTFTQGREVINQALTNLK